MKSTQLSSHGGLILSFVGMIALGCADADQPEGGSRTGGSGGDGSASGGTDGGGASSGGRGAGDGGDQGSWGGAATGGTDAGSGGAASSSGGDTGSGGSATDGPQSNLAAEYPCDGPTDGYDVVMTGSGDNWTISGGGAEQTITSGMADALSAAYGRLSGNANDPGKMLVKGDGTISASAQVGMPSNVVLNLCGTIDVTGTPSGSDRSPLYARGRTNISIPHATITGTAQYGMFFRDVSQLHLGEIYIDGTTGHGIRVDSHGSDDRNNAKNITMDYIHASNTGTDGVEIYGAVGIEIGTVVARRTGACGLLLDDSIDANIGLVDAVDAAWNERGYAAFRTANRNGRYDDGTYPTNIVLKELRASGANAGRGFFCVSESGGVEIETFTIDGVAGDPAIFIENCYNVKLAGASGSGALVGGRGYLGHNTGNGEASRDVVLQNITLSGGARFESNAATCGRNNQAMNVTGGSVDICQ